MSLANIFGSKPKTPVEPEATPEKKPEPVGLDKFAELFDNKTEKSEKRTPLDLSAMFKNPEFVQGLQKQVPQIIQGSISEDTKQKLQNNDPEALMQLLTETSSAVYMQALQHGAHLSNMVLEDKLDGLVDNTTTLVDRKLQDHALYSKRPQLQNPIVKAGTEVLINRLREQNPDITPEELDEQVLGYIKDLGQELGVVPSEDASSKESAEESEGTNWLESLGMTDVPELAPSPDPIKE